VGETPIAIVLTQNRPNPFEVTTEIRYGLPADGYVRLSVFNAAGQRVRTLVEAPQQAGFKSAYWDGRDEYGSRVSDGVYFYRLEVGRHVEMRKMVLLR
jgi:flagellar hook assembly protein FlgD